MKKNYIVCLLATVFLFAFQIGQAQKSLSENEFGSLIQDWLDKNKENYNLTENDISSLLVSDAYYSKKTKINHVYVNQAYQGIKIHNAISSVAVRDNYVFYYDNSLIPNIASKVNTITPAINAQAAINAVANVYDLGSVTNLSTISHTNNNYVFSNGNVSQKDIPVSLVFQPTLDGSIKLAWDLSIHTLNGQNWYSVRVDAVNGEIIDTNDWIIKCNFGDGNHATHTNHNTKKAETVNLFKSASSMMADGSSYSVIPLPFRSPSETTVTLVSEPASLNASPFGWHDVNGVAGAEFTITRGNNVYAQEDVNGNNGFGAAPDGGATLNFDYSSSSLNQEPSGYQDLSLTNLFYMNNIMHDVWYEYGFDEVSGNFQANNYGNGGSGSDFVIADGQDGSGLNNANFSTPPDGSNPGMQMYLWNGVPASPLTVNSGGPLTGSITAAVPATGAGNNITGPSTVPVTADLALVIDDNSVDNTSAPDYFPDFNDGCGAVTNGTDLSGKIVVIRRGNCPFVDKIQNAQDAGAAGVIVVNHNNPANDPNYVEYVGMSGTTNPAFTIPSVFINNADGEQLISALQNNEVINATIVSAPVPVQRDGSLDNEIVAHEYGHGISTRLAGGPSNSGCLGNAEQMGEGWSDWFALMITMKVGDLPETGRGIATYSTSEPVDGLGIRPFQYSTDTSINPLTYGDTNNTAITQPHGIGTVWATILWDLTWKYIEKYGFDPDIYNGTGGNNKVMQLVLDGLKLQTCNAGFVRGRNGILQADTALTGGEDQCMIWEVFAARGVGLSASQGNPQSRTDQVEDFNLPPDTNPTLQNCTSLSVDEFNESNYSIFPNPTNNVLNINVKKNFGKVNITLTDINGRVVMTQEANLSRSTELNISALQSGMYILTIKGENINTNDKIIKN
ncbi:T9SS-dependent M36 family metallopeptidase [Lacinutrix sp.]|uniref:T9SS-dependent M36 family metallopeptidase n=1 Tax=Lacinutrix sp. TaxID=1937692 RepID=UPI002629EC03|nr:T9SS-dependent M36 family metallopeptidase [Lacinutrix sp.]MDG1714726.1 T9SS-dependent M36 family metallopeptidase [Lacinutrix sp.]